MTLRGKVKLQRAAGIIYAGLFGIITLSVLFFNFYYKTYPFYPHYILAAFALAGILLALNRFLKDQMRGIVILMFVFFLTLQFIYAFYAYSSGGYDVSAVMTLAKSIAMTKLPVRNDYLASYFSAAPNNLFCGLIYGLALKAAMLLGFRNSDLCLAIINVLFVNCAAALMYNSAKKIIHQKCAIISVLVFYLLFGFSHHIVTPYTDSLGMVVVMLLIVVYIKIRESAKRGKIVFSLLFAVLSALGFLVKPQVLITSIAVLICDIFFDYKKNKYRIYFALALIAAIVYVPVNFYTRNNLIEGMDFSKETKIELFLLYGVCERDGTYGVWDGESYELYKSFTDEAERRSACLQRIGEKKKIWGHLVFRLSYTKSSVSHSATERFLLEEKAEESGCC